MRFAIALILISFFAGCQPASRYKATSVQNSDLASQEKNERIPAHYAWLPTKMMADVPIVFIPSSSKEWQGLPGFWNTFPPVPAGAPTAHLGQSPLGTVAALVLAEGLDAVKIKVPLGLPDPAPLVPAANPPTLGAWQLGRSLFFDELLEGETGRFACAGCHQPGHGFTDVLSRKLKCDRNTLGLLNIVYNKQQFWDGRVNMLEEVLARSLDDEIQFADRPAPKISPETTHRWGGLVKKLAANKDYLERFQKVYGVPQPTQDTIARALATYMRTLLSGTSLYDKADSERAARGDTVLAARHFLPFVDEAMALRLEKPKEPPEQLARRLENGLKLFEGKARCVLCHKGPLFTDQSFHNTGWGKSELYITQAHEGGRFDALPAGLKDPRFIGAYRTPTLRNLPRTGPYFHDGAQPTLGQAIAYYDHAIWPGEHLDPELRDGVRPQSLHLEIIEAEALELFLRSLDGEPVNPILIPKRK
jgi:cytochrome c peroxidase